MSTSTTRTVWPIPGGIYPPDHKQQSLGTAIRHLPLPSQLVIALRQPSHAPAVLCVNVGDHVSKGQCLAQGSDANGLSIHASTSGTVLAITEHAVPNESGLPELCVILQPDGESHWTKLPALADFRNYDAARLISRIAEAGICGLGGGAMPSATKLRAALLNKVHTLVINACECEPFITCDDALMQASADDIVAGIQILLHISAANRCVFAIEDNKPAALNAMRAALTDSGIELVVVPSIYPSGAEKLLIYSLTGSEIATGTLAVEQGFLCFNVSTAHAIARAVVHGEVLVSRITTITGSALVNPGNYCVLLGTPIHELLQHAAVDLTKVSSLIHGGSLTGIALTSNNVPVLATSACVIASTAAEIPAAKPEQNCIRCGFCTEVCPVLLLPQQLYWASKSEQLQQATALNLHDCIECGACSYVCPSHIPLVQYFRATKADIRIAEEKLLMANQSRARFEFHQARKAAEKIQEEQRRATRATLAHQQLEQTATPSLAQAAIAAAMARVKAKKALQDFATAVDAASNNLTTADSQADNTAAHLPNPDQQDDSR